MKKKAILLLITALFFISMSSAEIAITVPQQNKEIESLKTNYRIGFINNGPQKTVNLSSDAPEYLDISMPSTVTLPESGPESTPEGDNWYQVEPGKYLKIHYYSIEVSIDPQTDQRDFNFTVSAATSHQSGVARPEVENIRQLLFTLSTTSPEIDTSFDGDLFTENETSENEDQQSDSGVEEKELNSSSSSQNQSAENIQEEAEDSGFDGLTILLAVGITVSAAYVVLEGFL
ncbi:hypothetical protein [Candidatus Nanohalovita haloferacivicina]|uniref:hypothetical protein n=1 Tax=Candidatus Nanohalovita haloferacivicina TaxID=2978046 RepID=UPI00325FDCC2|nr:hypothetical protein HBNXNv_0188 [Candidatus Nanohalobia archaeon BNXNv]